jgi:hypothetical protein
VTFSHGQLGPDPVTEHSEVHREYVPVHEGVWEVWPHKPRKSGAHSDAGVIPSHLFVLPWMELEQDILR